MLAILSEHQLILHNGSQKRRERNKIMSENGTPQISDLEREFINEQKGEGSLSIYVANGDHSDYVGYDINPEDVEALYFEGIGVPRWETLQADTHEQQTALYWERFNERMGSYPLIGRMRDTDERVTYSAAEIPQLIEECKSIAGSTSDAKAQRAVQKVSLAATRAAEKQSGMDLKPSSHPDFAGGF